MNRVSRDRSLRADVLVLAGFAALIVLIDFLLGNGYGFHRDELQFLDDARHLQWGFVAYPPLTSFCARVAIALFEISPQVVRLPVAIVNACSLVLIGLMARQLGGRRPAQLLALAAAFPIALVFSSVLQYNSFDLFAWSIAILFVARVLNTGEERNWIFAGVGVGLGVLSKYSIGFLVVGLLAGLILLPSARKHLQSRWFWLGVLAAALIASPNLIWLASHGFITLQMEHHIHLRDVRNGRADGFFTDQLKQTLLAFPLAVAGLVSLLRSARFRLLSFCFLGPFVLLIAARGRGYYLLPAYPILYAAGAVAFESALAPHRRAIRIAARSGATVALLLGVAAIAWAYLPMWPVGSAPWNWQMKNNPDMANEVGWPEFVQQVAAVRDSLPPGDRTHLGVLANNFGEAGALELYGPTYNLPAPISSVNSFHARGYGALPPKTVVVVGGELQDQLRNFEDCRIAAYVYLPYGVHDEETDDHPEILVCHHLRRPWPEVWSKSQEFG